MTCWSCDYTPPIYIRTAYLSAIPYLGHRLAHKPGSRMGFILAYLNAKVYHLKQVHTQAPCNWGKTKGIKTMGFWERTRTSWHLHGKLEHNTTLVAPHAGTPSCIMAIQTSKKVRKPWCSLIHPFEIHNGYTKLAQTMLSTFRYR